jgi:D-alanyl-lipoteichoic acid acyltransferase DltB (MBOAT superfamily)
MSFDELRYFAFLPIVYVLYRALPHVGQNRMLLVASYFFYGAWDPRFLLLIIATTAMDYCAGLVIDRGHLEGKQAQRIIGLSIASACLSVLLDWEYVTGGTGGGSLFTDRNNYLLGLLALTGIVGAAIYFALLRLQPEARRKAAIIISMTGNLALLGFFKYFNFFIDSAESLLLSLGANPETWRLNIVLPVGISFYTFQTMSYTIDVYRRKLKATDRVLDFALFVAYFPPLVAGPIERAAHLLPQLSLPRVVRWEQSMQGLWLILFGLFKKIAIANGVAGSVNAVYGNTGAATWLDIVGATVLFAVQIYCDFSGYSDIARGTSKLFGIELIYNFRTPYFSTNPSEFWQRWHISLSSWLRDYLYIPLGGSRGTPAKTYRNLMLTMLLGGLWHGAAWNFVLWGLFHGSILSIHRALFGDRDHSTRSMFARLTAMAGFFAVTCYGWLLFRAKSLDQVVQFTLTLIVDFGNLATSMPLPTFAALVGMPILAAFEIAEYCGGLKQTHARLATVARGAVGAALLFVLLMGTSNAPQQFIYFQF